MRLVFMGTPDFAVPSLQALIDAGHEVLAVFTQPDRPAGRGKSLKASPVKLKALELGIPVFQPAKIKTPEAVEILQKLNPDCIIVVAYGQILNSTILKLPAKGCINVHASLLPVYRGAAPIHWAVINGEKLTGVTTMLMDEGLDTGDMLLKKEVSIPEGATTGSLHDELALVGSELLIETLAMLTKGELKAAPQSGPSSYAQTLRREHELLDWSRSAYELYNQIRGLNPWPGASTTFRGENLKIWQSDIYKQDKQDEPNPHDKNDYDAGGTFSPDNAGRIINVLKEGVVIQTGQGQLLVKELQPAGKRAMPARDFFLGRHAEPGERFGS